MGSFPETLTDPEIVLLISDCFFAHFIPQDILKGEFPVSPYKRHIYFK